METFGKIIREKRKSLSITQLALAEKIGVTASFITQCERGYAYPGENLFSPFAEFLGLEEGDVLSMIVREREVLGMRRRTYPYKDSSVTVKGYFFRELERIFQSNPEKMGFLDISPEESEILVLFRKATISQKNIVKSFLREVVRD